MFIVPFVELPGRSLATGSACSRRRRPHSVSAAAIGSGGATIHSASVALDDSFNGRTRRLTQMVSRRSLARTSVPSGDASARAGGTVLDNAADCLDGEQTACRIPCTGDSGIALETFRNGFRDLVRHLAYPRRARRFRRLLARSKSRDRPLPSRSFHRGVRAAAVTVHAVDGESHHRQQMNCTSPRFTFFRNHTYLVSRVVSRG
jgi:hypothetical protein